MTFNDDFVTPPSAQGARPNRFPLILEGNPGWTNTNLSLTATHPGDSAVNIGWCDKKTAVTRLMPLTADQARDLARELIVRAEIVDPRAGA